MALTAREWLLLSEKEQKQRSGELSPHECFLLRTSLAYVHFTEEEKASLTEQQKYQFIHPKVYTEKEKREFNKKAKAIFERMIDETKMEGWR